MTTRSDRRMRSVRLAVIGDSLLDEDVEGITERISPEAPVVVVSDVARARRPGGAALAAVLAAREGHAVSLVTAFAEDEAGRYLAEQIEACGVRLVNLGGGRVATKTRIRSQGRTLLMLDGSTEPEPHGAWGTAADDVVAGAQAVLVSDYGRGLTSDPAFRAAITEIVGRTPVVWDPHPNGAAPVPGITVATPNGREANHFAVSVPSGREVDHARHLVTAWGVGYVGVTLGDRGLVLVGDTLSAPLAVPAPVASAGDSLGAGDKFAGALAAGLAGGLLVTEAVSRAVGIASRYVADAVQGGRPGAVRRYPGERSPGDHRQVVSETRAAGGTIVATAGCFDLLHRGHVALLEQARLLGDCLVVLVNSDDSVRRLKGDPRPVVGEQDRASVLGALACVDAVAIFDDDTPERFLAVLRPDVYVKGGDYSIEQLPERVTVEACGGRVVLVPYLDGRSTSSMIDKTRSGSKPALQ